MTAERDFLTLNELAKSRLLPWRNIATVRNYVNTYSDIFKPKYRKDGAGRRYVIYRKDIEQFLKLWPSGHLKDIRSLSNAQAVSRRGFVSIVATQEYADKGKRLRDSAEKLGYRVDYLVVKTRTEFVRILSGTENTHSILVLLVKGRSGKISFPDNLLSSTDIRRMERNRGIAGKVLVLWSDTSLSKNFSKALTEKGSAKSVSLVVDSGPGGVKEISLMLERLLLLGVPNAEPSALLKKVSPLKGQK